MSCSQVILVDHDQHMMCDCNAGTFALHCLPENRDVSTSAGREHGKHVVLSTSFQTDVQQFLWLYKLTHSSEASETHHSDYLIVYII
jgi:hypothetical protein